MFGFLQVVCRKEQSVLRGLSEDINHNAGYVSLIKCCFVSECMCVCVPGGGNKTSQVRRQYAPIIN